MKDQNGNKITEHEFTKDIGHRTEVTKTIEEIVVDFYTTFKGNKFEASFCKLKEVEGKVAPYFMEDWIRETIKQIQSDLLKEVLKPEKLIDGKTYGLEWLRGFNYALEKYRDRIKKLAEEKEITLN